MNITVKKINRHLKDYKKIKKLMIDSFPYNELIPIGILVWYSKKSNIDFLAYYDNDELIGITYTINSRKTTFLLYLAIGSKSRSKGYGTEIINILKENKKDIVIDIEKIDKNSDNYAQRIKRLEFYKRNKFYNTKYKFYVGDDEYLLLSTNENFDFKDLEELLNKNSRLLYNVKIKE